MGARRVAERVTGWSGVTVDRRCGQDARAPRGQDLDEGWGYEPIEVEASEDDGLAAVTRFWRAFNRYDHGRCWSGDVGEEVEGVAMQWDLRGPARFEAERERALRTGGSRLAAKVSPPYGDAGTCGRAAYTLQLLAALYALAEQVEAEARARGWNLSVGVLAYREPEDEAEADEQEESPVEDLVTELDPEELACCDTLVLWVEVEVTDDVEAAWRLGDAFGRFIAGAGAWLERLDAGDREALRSVPRLHGR
jgi:hypothetical protein